VCVCVCVCVCVSLPAAREAGISSSITAALLKTNKVDGWMVVLGNDLAAFVLVAQVVNHYSLTILLK